MQYTTLGKTGFRVSRLGLGGAPFGGAYGNDDMTDQLVVEIVDAALDAGINFFDTAPLYGESERRLGLALKGKRHNAILATKAVKRGDAYSYENTILSVEKSLRVLQTDWIDLIQLHELEFTTFEQAVNETLPAFAKLKEQGKVRAIGVNARDISLLLPFIEQGLVDTVQNFSRYMLIDYTAKDQLLPLAAQRNVAVINGSVLGMGILADNPASFVKRFITANDEITNRMEQVEFLRPDDRKGALVEAAMRFSLSCPDISVTLTGVTSVQDVIVNAGYCDGIGLPEEDAERLLALFPGKQLIW